MLLEKIRDYIREKGIKMETGINLKDVVSYEEYLNEKGVADTEEERKLYSKFIIGIYPYILQIIRNKIGEQKYSEVLRKNDELKKHIFETLNLLNVMNYMEQLKLINDSLKWLFKDEIEIVDPRLITNINGKYYYDSEEVEVRWLPAIWPVGKKQIIVNIEDFHALQKERHHFAIRNEDLPFTFRDIVKDAYQKDASDIHIAYDSDNNYHVFFRIGAEIIEQPQFLLSKEKGDLLIKSIKIETSNFTKGKVFIDDPRKVWDARIEYENLVGTVGVDLRLAFIPDGLMRNQEVVARILHKQKIEGKTLLELGYYPNDAEVIERASKRIGGLFIISGITNSGKSTTLSTIVASLPKNKKIETIEDPIEYVIPNPNVVQHQIYEPPDESEKVSFNEYIKGFKRADPDIIMISEIRKNPELVSALIEGARAGQMIFSTIHINSAFDIYKSFYDLFQIEKETILQLILFSMNQILIPKLCQHCKIEDKEHLNKKRLLEIKNEIPFAVTDKLEAFLENNAKTYIRNEKGCQYCRNGYNGRVVVYEYFYPNVKFIDWLSSGEYNRYAIERKVYEMKLGKNKLEIFLKRLEDGITDVSDLTLRAII